MACPLHSTFCAKVSDSFTDIQCGFRITCGMTLTFRREGALFHRGLAILAGTARSANGPNGQNRRNDNDVAQTSVCEDALYELATAGFMTKETSFLIGEKVSVLTVSFLFKVFLGNEPKGGRVDAIPQPCRRGTVREDMPEVGIGVFASHLGTDRE